MFGGYNAFSVTKNGVGLEAAHILSLAGDGDVGGGGGRGVKSSNMTPSPSGEIKRKLRSATARVPENLEFLACWSPASSSPTTSCSLPPPDTHTIPLVARWPWKKMAASTLRLLSSHSAHPGEQWPQRSTRFRPSFVGGGSLVDDCK